MNDIRRGPAAGTRQYIRQRQPHTTYDNNSNNMETNIPPPAAAAAAHNTDHLPGPGMFCGRPEDRGQDWLQNFELWARCKALNDNVKVAALSLHLRESAATWLTVLPDGDKDTWPHIRAAFVARYGFDQQPGWQQATLVWTMQQLPGEPVLDFIAKVQHAARNINLPEEQQRFAIINGLRPAIRLHVLRQNPADMAALRQAAVLAQQTEQPGTDDNSLAIQRIERQLQQLTLSSLQSRGPCDRHRLAERPYDDQYNPSSRSPSTDRRPARHRDYDPSARQSYPSRSPSIERHLPDEDNNRRDQRTYYHRSATPAGQRRVSFAADNRVAPSTRHEESETTYPTCASCGRANHRRHECYFRDAICTYCNRPGHIQRACRTARH